MSTTDTPVIPMLERRKLEAKLLKHVYDVLKERHGVSEAQKAIGESVRRAAIAQGQEMAQTAGAPTSLQSFADILPLWTMDDALKLEVLDKSETVLNFNVTRCRYAELYREMGLAEIGHLLSCQRDGSFCEGYDPNLTMERTQTIMQGASHCDFRYRYEKDPTKQA
jgi:hypothetical protein